MQAQSNERLSPTFQTIIDCFPEDLFKDGLVPFRDLSLYNAKRDDYGSGVPEQGIAPDEASTNNRPCT